MADPYAAYRGGYGYGEGGYPGHGRREQQDSRQPPGYPPYAAPPAQNAGPNFRWWIPATGIRRDVIQADIQRYLGPDALVRPGEGRDENAGRNGYWIAAYRTLTPAMIEDLRADSANFERLGDRGKYEDSVIHRSRQHWGPTSPQQPEPSGDRPVPRAETLSTAYSQNNTPSQQSTTGYSTAYGGTQPTYGTSTSSSTGSSNYTHYPAPQEQAANQGSSYSHYSSESGPGRASHPSNPSYVPRSQHGYSAPTNQGQASYNISSNPSATQQAAPAGYYLASDGKYYPESSRPQG